MNRVVGLFRGSRAALRRSLLAVPLILVVAAGAAAFRPAVQPGTPSAPGDTLSWAGTVLRVALATAFVLAAVYGTIWLLKKFLQARGGRSEAGPIAVLSTSYLAPRKQISLVQVFDRILVIGVTDAGISVLTEFDREDFGERLRELERSAPTSASFLSVFRNTLLAGPK